MENLTRPSSIRIGGHPVREDGSCLEMDEASHPIQSGWVDFHSLRGTFITNVVASGASVKTAQTLARHADPAMTIGRYAKTSIHDVVGAIEGLPDLNTSTPERESTALKATGTAGSINRMNVVGSELADYLPSGETGTVRMETHGAAILGSTHQGKASPEVLDFQGFAASYRIELHQDVRAGELGFEPRLTDPESVVLPLHHSPKECDD